MNIAIITDQHFGARNENDNLDYHFQQFYENVFFPHIDKYQVTDIFDLGDTFDRRKTINFLTLKKCQEYWFTEIQKRNINLHILLGNHTVYYKNTNRINSPNILLNNVPNIKIYEKPEIVKVNDGKVSVMMLPWINKENEKESFEFVAENQADMVMAHLELTGFQMNAGIICDSGYDPKLFKNQKQVLTGHFHKKMSSGNVHYLGSPYAMNWAEANHPHGFYIWNPDESSRFQDFEFVENPYDAFVEIHYKDQDIRLDEYDFSVFERKFVRVYTYGLKNREKFDLLISKIYENNPENVKIIDKAFVQNTNQIGLDVSCDMQDIIQSFVEKTFGESKEIQPKRLVNVAMSLYNKAIMSNSVVSEGE